MGSDCISSWSLLIFLLCCKILTFFIFYQECLTPTSNVLKDLPEAKVLNPVKHFARIQSLNVWISSLAHANSLFKIIFQHNFFLYVSQFSKFCCTFYNKGEGSQITWIGLINHGKIKINEQKCLSTFLCAEHFYFQEWHWFSCVDPLLLCYKVLNMGRIALFLCFSVNFKSLIANLTRGTANLQKEILTVLRFGQSL